MNSKAVFIILIVLNVLALAFSAMLDYVWYQGALTDFSSAHQGFTGDVPISMMIANFFSKYALYITIFNIIVFLTTSYMKNIAGLIAVLVLSFWKVAMMIYIMYGNMISMS